jgi:hypothetical protein
MNPIQLILLTSVAVISVSAQQTGELSPHYSGNSFQYVGDFHNNYVYIIKNDEGRLGVKDNDNKYYADVISAREQFFVMARRPSDGKLALIEYTHLKNPNFQLNDINFLTPPDDSMLAKAWLRLSNAKKYESDRKKGQKQEWFFVGINAQERLSETYYVSIEIKTDPKSSLQFTSLLTVTNERYSLILDPTTKKYTPIVTDPLGTPLDKPKNRDMSPGGMAAAVLRLLKIELEK